MAKQDIIATVKRPASNNKTLMIKLIAALLPRS
jgi:hypothetical protein